MMNDTDWLGSITLSFLFVSEASRNGNGSERSSKDHHKHFLFCIQNTPNQGNISQDYDCVLLFSCHSKSTFA